VLPEHGTASGLPILRDGEPGESEVTLSPLRYHPYQHRAEIDAVVQDSGRDVAFDTLRATSAWPSLPTARRAASASGSRPENHIDLPVEGAASPKAAAIPAVLKSTDVLPG